MDNTESKLPRDEFSIRRRELSDNPGILESGSTVHRTDFYGNLETWVVETYRADGQTVIFLQCSRLQDPVRLMLPPEVTGALYRQDLSLLKRSVSRGAKKAAATREALGIKPAFLKKKKGDRK